MRTSGEELLGYRVGRRAAFTSYSSTGVVATGEPCRPFGHPDGFSIPAEAEPVLSLKRRRPACLSSSLRKLCARAGKTCAEQHSLFDGRTLLLSHASHDSATLPLCW